MKRSLIIVAAAAALPGMAQAGSYSTGFENPPFTTGSINGQDGWSSTNASFDQEVVNTVSLTGTQSWHRTNQYTTGSFGDQPLSAPLSGGDMVGETGTANADDQMHSYSLWFRAGNTTAADGSFINLSLTDAPGSRINYVGLGNTDAGGVSVIAYDVQSNGAGNAASFIPYDLTGSLDLSRDEWHKLTVETTFVSGADNDIVKISLDDTLAGTIGSWEDYYRHDPEQIGNGNVLFAADRVGFYTRGSAVSGADGFYFDDFSQVSAVPEPAAFGLIGIGAAALLLRRRRRIA